MISIIISILLIITNCQGSAQQDRVTLIIPGYTKYPWYSGYLTISRSTSFHYVFFVSQHDPMNDPLILWLNGGPGCSSLIGMVYENGPFVFLANSTNLKINEYAWNKKANLLYIQSPGSVGFSYGPILNSDESVAKDNLEALRSFYGKFPQYRKNDFYISGQSYAGIYVPYLALEIHNYNTITSTSLPINLKGIIVGNACTDPRECYAPGPNGTSLFQYQFLYKHSFYTQNQYQMMKAACTLAYDSQNCQIIRDDLDDKFAKTKTSILNIYDLCYSQASSKSLMKRGISKIIRGDLDCDDQLGGMHFFNDKVIQAFLHVNMDSSFVWQPCNDQLYQKYKQNQNASYWIYPILMKAGYRMWVYSGDVDADVPITGTVSWMRDHLRFDFNIPIEEPWREWWSTGRHPYQDQVGGMVWKLENLTFVSVKNAGHMVPRDQPKLAFTLIDSFLNGQDLPQKQFNDL